MLKEKKSASQILGEISADAQTKGRVRKSTKIMAATMVSTWWYGLPFLGFALIPAFSLQAAATGAFFLGLGLSLVAGLTAAVCWFDVVESPDVQDENAMFSEYLVGIGVLHGRIWRLEEFGHRLRHEHRPKHRWASIY